MIHLKAQDNKRRSGLEWLIKERYQIDLADTYVAKRTDEKKNEKYAKDSQEPGHQHGMTLMIDCK